MIGVFDACVIVKLFLNEADSELATAVVRKTGTIYAPDIIRAEVTSAITRAFRNGTISFAEADKQIELWQRFRSLGNVRFVPFAELLDSAAKLSLELKHPLVDCLYLALAVREGISLITTDDPLLTVAASLPNIRHLREFMDS